MLLHYDPHGGYGHRDHIKVHQVGRRAAELAGTPRVLEATMPRDAAERLLRLAHRLRIPVRFTSEELSTRFSPRSDITHRLDVRRYARQKQAALAAHRSQINGTGRMSTAMRKMIRLPAPLFSLLLGREWFIDVSPSAPHSPSLALSRGGQSDRWPGPQKVPLTSKNEDYRGPCSSDRPKSASCLVVGRRERPGRRRPGRCRPRRRPRDRPLRQAGRGRDLEEDLRPSPADGLCRPRTGRNR